MKPSDNEPGFTPSGIDSDFASPAEWARLYRLRGIQVVPAFMPSEVKPGQSWKRPLLKSWTEFQEALVPDEVFLPWYGPGGLYSSRLNMGIITGRASNNLFVIDLDYHKNSAAMEWWYSLMEVHNNAFNLETVEQRTGGGGGQKLFRAPPGWTAPTCKTSIGVDIRGQGGFAVLAPSMHDSGKAYEWLEGQSPDDIPIAMAPDWLLEAVEALVREHGGTSAPNGKSHQAPPQGDYDAFGRQSDGREDKMFRMVWRCVVQWHRGCPIQPSAAESARKAQQEYEVYERLVTPQQPHPADLTKTQMLDREGRGWEVWWKKWSAAMRHWQGKVFEEAGKPDPSPEEEWTKKDNNSYRDYTDEFAKAEEHSKTTGDIFPYLDVDGIMDKPDPVWAVEDLINERALGFIFGPPSSLKTFIAIDLALSLASRRASFWGRKINTPGAVVYLCREGTSSFKLRIQAWEIHRQCKARGVPFYLIEQPCNFMDPADVGKTVATIQAIAGKAGVPVSAVMVDTVSRVLPGAEENLQRDMSMFVRACELIQQAFSCIVIGIHHTNKNGTIRGSSVIPGAGDFLIETRREPGADAGSIVLAKIKDGEDGQELPFKVVKVELGGIVPRSSLVVDPTEAAPAASAARAKDGLPDIMICREILAALAQAWFKGTPWGKDNGTYPAATTIMGRWFLKRSMANRLIKAWMEDGAIEYTQMPGKNRVKGYRKLVDI